MSAHPAPGSPAAPGNRIDSRMGLIDARDELDVARHFVVCLWLACQAPGVPGPERAALCAVASAARDKLDEVGAAFDVILQGRPDKA